MRLKLYHILIITLLSSHLTAQKWSGEYWGLQVGISADIGTHINQIGLKVQGYYTSEFIQFNLGNQIRFNSSNLGGRKNYVTQRINTGIALFGGEKNSRPQLILDGLNHQSQHDYAIAYNYLWYTDNAGTSQRSGGFGLHIKQISFYVENDLFSGTGGDRFRTSHASVSYHDDLYNFSLNTQLWTGDTRGTRLLNTVDSMYIIGYKDLSTTQYGRSSNGILSVGFDYQIIYGNHFSAVAGIDSERVRHGLQNRFMHNKKFIPMRWRKPNVNYPMLNSDGYPVHYKEEAAPPKLFLQFGLNRSFTY
jgi:hypothetical protein